MTFPEIAQIRAYGRIDGLWMALYWTVSFALVVASPSSSFGALLALFTPVFMVWRTAAFRDKALSGRISFGRALYYGFVMTTHAICVFAIIQFIYLKFYDGGRFAAQLSYMVEQLSEAYAGTGIDVSQLKTGAETIATATPVELMLSFMMQNFMLSVPLCFLSALMTRKKKASSGS